jgi:hypothetical protein
MASHCPPTPARHGMIDIPAVLPTRATSPGINAAIEVHSGGFWLCGALRRISGSDGRKIRRFRGDHKGIRAARTPSAANPEVLCARIAWKIRFSDRDTRFDAGCHSGCVTERLGTGTVIVDGLGGSNV